MWIIVDWANNPVFGMLTFDTSEDALEYLFEHLPDGESLSDYEIRSYEEARKTWL